MKGLAFNKYCLCTIIKASSLSYVSHRRCRAFLHSFTALALRGPARPDPVADTGSAARRTPPPKSRYTIPGDNDTASPAANQHIVARAHIQGIIARPDIQKVVTRLRRAVGHAEPRRGKDEQPRAGLHK